MAGMELNGGDRHWCATVFIEVGVREGGDAATRPPWPWEGSWEEDGIARSLAASYCALMASALSRGAHVVHRAGC